MVRIFNPYSETNENSVIDNNRLDANKVAAIIAIEKGQNFAQTNPDIVNDRHLSSSEIAAKYDVMNKFGVTWAIAKNIVREAFKVLLSAEDLEKRKNDLTRKARERDRINGTGLYGITKEKRIEYATLGGSAGKGVTGNRAKGGDVTRNLKKGIHALSREQLQNAAFLSHQTRQNKWFGGEKINGMDEGEYLQYLAQQHENQHQSGQHHGKPDIVKIINLLNNIYHNNRTRNNLVDFFQKYHI